MWSIFKALRSLLSSLARSHFKWQAVLYHSCKNHCLQNTVEREREKKKKFISEYAYVRSLPPRNFPNLPLEQLGLAAFLHICMFSLFCMTIQTIFRYCLSFNIVYLIFKIITTVFFKYSLVALLFCLLCDSHLLCGMTNCNHHFCIICILQLWVSTFCY